MNKIKDDKVDFISTALGVRTEIGVEMLRAAMECVQLFEIKGLTAHPEFPRAAFHAPAFTRDALKTIAELEWELERRP